MKAPMGGTVLEVKVKPGDAVKPGDTLLVYEAMKMENNLTADRAGVIAKCLIEDGDVMSTDQPIFEFAGACAAPKAAPAPKPAPKAAAPAPKKEAAPKCECKPVTGIDTSRAYPALEGGSAAPVLPNARKAEGSGNAPVLRLAEGTTLEINVSPYGGINIRITTGK